ncbi:DUF6541 family protein [Microbacterium sp. NPDC077184]|uniref:DUF6541 family protein n=1 Tax=Microbacterium sp. NPDC077184 TaxID=3154764 RepID=UPI003419E86D
MSPWGAALPAIVVAAGVLFLPGLAVAFAAGARGFRLWALAAPLTFTLAGVSAVVLQMVGIGLNPAAFGATVLLTAAAAAVVRVLYRRRAAPAAPPEGAPQRPAPPASVWRYAAPIAGVLLAAVAIGARIMTAIADPTAIAQLFDNVFHLNAVALIAASGEGSSLTLGNLTEASRMFYPAAFHDVAALIAQLSGAGIPVVMNATALLLCAVVWPVSALYLATRIFGTRPEVLIFAGALAGVFGSFPYRLLSFGVLYPFLAGLTLLPVLLGLIVEFFDRSRADPRERVLTVVAVVAVAPGIALTHPSVIVAGAVLGTPFAIGNAIRSFRKGQMLSGALAVAYLIGATGAFVLVRPPLNSAPWTPSQTYKEAIGAVLTLSPGSIAIPWVVFGLVLLGFVGAARHPKRFAGILAMFGIGALIYFASAAVANDTIRDLLSGVWYRDTERVAAIFTIAAFPLVLGGGLVLATATRAGLSRARFPRGAGARRLTAAVVVVAIVLLGTVRGPIPQAQEWIHQSFGQHGVEQLLSADERALMSDVEALVPVDGVVVGSPRTGASLTPVFAHREALAPHIFGNRTTAEQYLLDNWDQAGIDPAVCEYIQELNAFWALDFGTDDVLGGVHPPLAGTDDLDEDDAPRVTEIARVGDAALYEATVCGPPSR